MIQYFQQFNRYFVIPFVLLLVSSYSFGQSIEEKLADIVCDCFKQSSLGFEEFFRKEIESCFKNSAENYKAEFAFKYGIDTTSTSKDGYKLGYEIGKKAIPLLIPRCDLFYLAFGEFRKNFLGSVNRDVETAYVKSTSELIENNQTLDNYLQRAMSYYKLGEYKKAMNDIKTIFKIDSNNVQGYLLRAFIFDVKGDYKKAIVDYKKCKELTQKMEFDLFVAFSERRLKER